MENVLDLDEKLNKAATEFEELIKQLSIKYLHSETGIIFSANNSKIEFFIKLC